MARFKRLLNHNTKVVKCAESPKYFVKYFWVETNITDNRGTEVENTQTKFYIIYKYILYNQLAELKY